MNEGPLTSQPPPPASSGRIVLLAENDPQVADLEKMVLMQAGYSVTLAETGPEALRLVRMQLPVAVVLESDLPDVNGVEVCRQLKADPLTHHIPVLFCTADPSAHQLARDAGADDFLVKPGEVMQLGERVTRLLKN